MNPSTTSRRRPLLGFDLVDDFAQQLQLGAPVPAPIGPTRLRVVARVKDGIRQDFSEPFDMALKRNPSGVWLFEGLVRGRSDRTYRRLSQGRYVIRVTSRNYRSLDAGDVADDLNGNNQPVHFPPPGPTPKLHALRLSPGYAYPFPRRPNPELLTSPTILRGSVRHADGRGAAEARIEVRGEVPADNRAEGRPEVWTDHYVTDGTGQWLFVLPDVLFDNGRQFEAEAATARVDLTVFYAEPELPPVIVERFKVKQQNRTALLETSIRGRLLDKTSSGIEDAQITVRDAQESTIYPGATRTDVHGRFFYSFRFDQLIGRAEDTVAVVVVARLAGGGAIQQPADIRIGKSTDVSLQPS